MATSAQQQMFNALSKSMGKQKRQQRSDDIIDFITDHWYLFASSRAVVRDIKNRMGRDFPYTVDSLCDQLSIPANIFFKRCTAMELRGLFINFMTSKLRTVFIQCAKQSPDGEVCLFLVAGKSSLCVTNMQTSFEPGMMITYYKSTGELPDIHMFRVEDLPRRLPRLIPDKE